MLSVSLESARRRMTKCTRRGKLQSYIYNPKESPTDQLISPSIDTLRCLNSNNLGSSMVSRNSIDATSKAKGGPASTWNLNPTVTHLLTTYWCASAPSTVPRASALKKTPKPYNRIYGTPMPACNARNRPTVAPIVLSHPCLARASHPTLSPSNTCRPHHPHIVPRHMRRSRPSSLINRRCPAPRNSPNPCPCKEWSTHWLCRVRNNGPVTGSILSTRWIWCPRPITPICPLTISSYHRLCSIARYPWTACHKGHIWIPRMTMRISTSSSIQILRRLPRSEPCSPPPFFFLSLKGYFLLDPFGPFFLTPYDVMHVYYTCSDFLSLLFWGYFPPRSLWLDSGAIGILITSVQCTGFSGFGVSVILFLFFCVIFSGVLKRGFQAASILVYFFFLSF